MKIVVLNGSPKGNNSYTLHYVLFLKKKFPEISFEFFNVAESIIFDNQQLIGITEAIGNADAVIWSFPVYIFHVPAQLIKFIEEIEQSGKKNLFSGKYSFSVSTSIHLRGSAALNYIRSVSLDWGMVFTQSFNVGTNDLLMSDIQARWISFFQFFLFSIENKIAYTGSTKSQPYIENNYIFTPPQYAIASSEAKILIISDSKEKETDCSAMTDYLMALLGNKAEMVNLSDIDIKEGCKGCLSCGYDNTCIYSDTDGFTSFFKDKIMTADIIVLSGQVNNHFLSNRWKLFFDRSYFVNHTMSMKGKYIACIITGDTDNLADIKSVITDYFTIQEANMIDIITNQNSYPSNVSKVLEGLARRLILSYQNGYTMCLPSETIGMKYILETALKNRFGFVYIAAYKKYFKTKHNIYTQSDIKKQIFNKLLMILISLKFIRKKIPELVKRNTLKSFKKLIEKS